MTRRHERPLWVAGLVSVVIATLLLAATDTLLGESRAEGLPGTVVHGAIFGTYGAFVAGLVTRRKQRRLADSLPSATPGQLEVAQRAVQRGPVPTDPDVRRLAIEVARHELVAAGRVRRVQVMSQGFLVVVSVVLALTWSPWWLVLGAVGAGILIAVWSLTARLERRLERLSSPPG